MSERKFLELIEKLEAEIVEADEQQRRGMQGKLQSVLLQMQDRGMAVPRRLRKLDNDLTDEAVETMFDNMPV